MFSFGRGFRLKMWLFIRLIILDGFVIVMCFRVVIVFFVMKLFMFLGEVFFGLFLLLFVGSCWKSFEWRRINWCLRRGFLFLFIFLNFCLCWRRRFMG